MPARLLAYGGTSFSERRRIGQWPAVPEATLRDTYGLTANGWCFGVGTLGNQPFVILRQRQNVENRGGYPFSLLLDPGDEMWQKFGWNGAAVVAAILQNEPKLLLETPERCSSEALERIVAELSGERAFVPASSPEDLHSLLIASAVQNEAIVVPGVRPTPDQMAAILDPLPVCFRLSAGWLVGGGAAHGRTLGANLVIDDQAAVDPQHLDRQRAAALTYSEAWTSVSDPTLIQNFGTKPIWTWEVEAGSFFRALVLLRDLESAPGVDEALLERMEQTGQTTEALDRKIEQAATGLVTRSTEPLGPRATKWLLGLSLVGEKRKLDAKTASRLDPKTTQDELRRSGYPPAKLPARIQLSRELRVRLWSDYLERLRADAGKNLETALNQLGPDLTDEERRQLADAGLAALPASDEKLGEWDRFRKYPEMWTILQPALLEEALKRVRRGDKGAEETYLKLGGIRLQPVAQPVFGVPQRRREPDRLPEFREALESLLFQNRASSVEQKIEELRAQFNGVTGVDLDGMIAENCATSGAKFASAFAGKYMALGDVMSFLSEASQERLMDCLAEHEGSKFQGLAARDITYAINNAGSRNAYTQALARYVLKHPELNQTVAKRRLESPSELDRRLKSMLAKRGRRA